MTASDPLLRSAAVLSALPADLSSIASKGRFSPSASDSESDSELDDVPPVLLPPLLGPTTPLLEPTTVAFAPRASFRAGALLFSTSLSVSVSEPELEDSSSFLLIPHLTGRPLLLVWISVTFGDWTASEVSSLELGGADFVF